MVRSVWKLPFSKTNVFQKVFLNSKEKKTIMILSKNSMIFPIFVGHTFLVYNGKKFTVLQIFDFMIGYKFGCFLITRKKF